MSTNNNNSKLRQKVKSFEASYTKPLAQLQQAEPVRVVNTQAKEELTKQFNKPLDFLSSFLRSIYVERGIGWNQINRYISLYLRDLVARDPSRSTKDIGTARGNIMKELNRGTMTWKNFESKIRLIRIIDMEVQLTLTDDRGVKTVHTAKYRNSTIPVDMGMYDDGSSDE